MTTSLAPDPTVAYLVDWDALRARFASEQISQVDQGFGPIDTINHAHVTNRLNIAAPGWTYEITRFIEVDGKDGFPHLLAVYGWMQVGGIRRFEVGEVEHPATYGDELKKALSDFIKRAAMRFGVGLDLWAKEDLETSPESQAPARDLGDRSSAPADETPGRETDAREPEDAAFGEGADPTAPRVAGPNDWARAARMLKTTRPLAQAQVMEFLTVALIDIRSLEQVSIDDLAWALSSIKLAKQTQEVKP
jgi:hypothetical protein